MAREISAADPNCVVETVAVLRRGGLVCLPTDTVYGLAAAADDEEAVARVYAVKGRAADKPLPLFLAEATALETVCAEVPPVARRLAEAFWPGELTLVLPRAPGFCSLALAGGETVAVRVPAHALVLAIVRELGQPVTGTSANRFGQASPATAEEARTQIGGAVDLLIDGGACLGGVESTIVDLTGARPVVLRQGAVAAAHLARVLGEGVLL